MAELHALRSVTMAQDELLESFPAASVVLVVPKHFTTSNSFGTSQGEMASSLQFEGLSMEDDGRRAFHLCHDRCSWLELAFWGARCRVKF